MKNRLNNWLQRIWYQRTSPPVLLRPLSHLFRHIVLKRRAWYGAHPEAARRLPVPVIVIGNLSVGGTGKTPLVIWMARFLTQAGYRPGIVSRGYGVRLRQPLLVTAEFDPAQAGDEPVLIAQKTACPVSVFPDRARAADVLLAAGCDLIISDDGMQHYRMARDIEIALIDGDRRLGNGACLPGGPLREPVERLDSVDFVVCNGGQAQPGEYPMLVTGSTAVNLANETVTRPLAAFQGEKLLALAAIGNPQRFFNSLQETGLTFAAKVLPDHHAFVASDVEQENGITVLMTEKDAVKCRKFNSSALWYVPVEAELPIAFGDRVLDSLKKITKVKQNG
ncbi:tetraacyldisaccharide 4'-kinase [Candidatus Methylospira mobilis]|uniref:Tetraacyldisaccharide 4'-kinase n=1 Tax=Candidatus Methylospira mobilis TaxID=1808979 RepID=A0A5Q0BHB7_9GAMM|nr:tetraacyldisaccharide 4'-kinase [Candidatus Methylospira mobilis]QFY42522.1 tetraacyldisaccharide 4'-kinase [Candidatus Methylospira mobilis]WNV04371.1 tetraacyldisaccharide 4'-kinase [Candidatus Methylospira mobilis]